MKCDFTIVKYWMKKASSGDEMVRIELGAQCAVVPPWGVM